MTSPTRPAFGEGSVNPGEGDLRVRPIGVLRSCFPEKFGIPRQPGLVSQAEGIVRLYAPYDREEAFRGLEHYSHLWLTFIFHQSPATGWSPTIRPPRLGGNQRLGVFASRSPFRPNRLGLSAVRHEGLVRDDQGLYLKVSGIDLVDGTPILDIKPYLPYADALSDAVSTLAEPPPALLEVRFSAAAQAAIDSLSQPEAGQLQRLIAEVLGRDPRPAYRRGKTDRHCYGFRLHDLNIRFSVREPVLTVSEIVKFCSADQE